MRLNGEERSLSRAEAHQSGDGSRGVGGIPLKVTPVANTDTDTSVREKKKHKIPI